MTSVWAIEWRRAGEVQQVWPDRVTGEPSCIEDDIRSKRQGGGRVLYSLLPESQSENRSRAGDVDEPLGEISARTGGGGGTGTSLTINSAVSSNRTKSR
jgi:hypothetical protein